MIATFHSGQSGYITVTGTRLDITDWQHTLTARLAEKTNSGSGGHAQFHKVLEEGQGSCNIPWDSENIPDVDITLDTGDEFTFRGYLGDSGKFYQYPAIVESTQVTVNTQNDIIRMTVNYRVNGAVTKPVT